MVNPQTGSLAGTGMVLGMLHVLTGPDHLSALATISSNSPPLKALWLGVRWGVGHSVGLLLVGSIFIALTVDSDDAEIEIPRGVSKFFESLVGVFMLVLGMYGFWRAWMIRPKAVEEGGDDDDDDDKESGLFVEEPAAYEEDLDDDRTEQVPETQDAESRVNEVVREEQNIETDVQDHIIMAAGNDAASMDDHVMFDSDTEPVKPPTHCSLCHRLAQRLSTGTMALLAGIIHGLAGPGGVLGVIPAVQLHDWRLATLYLSCFCLMSILTMGLFALVYGALSHKVGGINAHRQFLIQFCAAGLSVLIGILWLILLGIDKLDVVFP